ncbi:MAG: sugar ABC transporter permease [Geminicoccaceae bacterium]|nr:sugar ABC transporter permease [Geminicoccaceae bacterium]MCX7630984.1 sugar ABC transporter permease [Geminicoccaceae bacterium]MDW8126007.1 sugar ABC transporter permease [Geminicoccaceae bacterium]
MRHGFREPWIVVFWFLAPALAGLALFRLVPILIALVGGFTGTKLTGETIWVGLRNYERLLDDPSFWNSVRVTLLFNLVVNPLQILLALGLALLVFRPTPLVPFFRAAYMAPMTVSLSLTSILWAILLEPTMGPVNGLLRAMGLPPQPFWRGEDQALATLVGVASWKGVGYWMVFLLAGLLLVPKELHEAAMIDGAGAWQRFCYVTLPLMRRPLGFVLVADTAANFLLFAPVYLVTQGGPNGATALLMFEAYQAAFTYLDHGRALAVSTVILLVIGLLAFFELRLLRERGA